MVSPPFSLRPARPLIDEGLVFARYLDVAADGAFRAMLGRKAGAIIAAAYLSPGHDLSHEGVTFATTGSAIVGMASGYTAEEHRHSSDDPLTSAAGIRMWRMAIVTALGRRLFNFIEEVPEGDFYLQAVAVDDDARGRGLGSALMDHAEDLAREKGCDRIVLDVASDNAAARRLYERRGMTVEAESPRLLLIPGMRALRMVKTL